MSELRSEYTYDIIVARHGGPGSSLSCLVSAASIELFHFHDNRLSRHIDVQARHGCCGKYWRNERR